MIASFERVLLFALDFKLMKMQLEAKITQLLFSLLLRLDGLGLGLLVADLGSGTRNLLNSEPQLPPWGLKVLV